MSTRPKGFIQAAVYITYLKGSHFGLSTDLKVARFACNCKHCACNPHNGQRTILSKHFLTQSSVPGPHQNGTTETCTGSGSIQQDSSPEYCNDLLCGVPSSSCLIRIPFGKGRSFILSISVASSGHSSSLCQIGIFLFLRSNC